MTTLTPERLNSIAENENGLVLHDLRGEAYDISLLVDAARQGIEAIDDWARKLAGDLIAAGEAEYAPSAPAAEACDWLDARLTCEEVLRSTTPDANVVQSDYVLGKRWVANLILTRLSPSTPYDEDALHRKINAATHMWKKHARGAPPAQSVPVCLCWPNIGHVSAMCPIHSEEEDAGVSKLDTAPDNSRRGYYYVGSSGDVLDRQCLQSGDVRLGKLDAAQLEHGSKEEDAPSAPAGAMDELQRLGQAFDAASPAQSVPLHGWPELADRRCAECGCIDGFHTSGCSHKKPTPTHGSEDGFSTYYQADSLKERLEKSLKFARKEAANKNVMHVTQQALREALAACDEALARIEELEELASDHEGIIDKLVALEAENKRLREAWLNCESTGSRLNVMIATLQEKLDRAISALRQIWRVCDPGGNVPDCGTSAFMLARATLDEVKTNE